MVDLSSAASHRSSRAVCARFVLVAFGIFVLISTASASSVTFSCDASAPRRTAASGTAPPRCPREIRALLRVMRGSHPPGEDVRDTPLSESDVNVAESRGNGRSTFASRGARGCELTVYKIDIS